MKKAISIISIVLLSTLLTAGIANAASNLWEYYDGDLPSMEERAETYLTVTGNVDVYTGTAYQNEEFLMRLEFESFITETPSFGGTFKTPQTIAFFETSLQAGISSSATSMTLLSGTDKDGNTLASSTYAFVIDEGTASEEIVLADCTDTACTNMTRGVSVLTGTSSVATLQKAHRRGASVKITDASILLFLTNVFKGTQEIENMITYKSSVSACDANDDICDKEYIDGVAVAGAPDMNPTTKGIGEEATITEAANQAPNGSGGTTAPLVITTELTSATTTSTNVIPVTDSTGVISPQFIATSTTADIYNFGQDVNHDGILTANATSSFSGASTTPAIFNGVEYTFPATQGASSSALVMDKNGALSPIPLSRLLIAESVSVAVTGASSTLASVPILANELGNNRAVIKGSIHMTAVSIEGADDEIRISLNYGGKSIAYINYTDTTPSTGGTLEGDLVFYMIWDGTNQFGSMVYSGNVTTTTGVEEVWTSSQTTISVDTTVEQTFSIEGSKSGASGNFTAESVYMELIQ